MTLKTLKPENPYPKRILTIGDRLRQRRLDLDLTQQEAADRIGVFKTQIFRWETNRIAPNVRFMPKIFEFLGCVPYSANLSLAEKLKIWRQSLGLTQKELAQKIGISNSTLLKYENSCAKPPSSVLKAINEFFSRQFGTIWRSS